MATELRTVTTGQTQIELAAALLLEPRHNSFPVVDAADGTLAGLLLRSELDACRHPSATVEVIMDRAPAIVQPEWPLERAHRLFAALGLRHLIVVSRAGRPVGMLTRHDLQQQHPPHRQLPLDLSLQGLVPACRRRRRLPPASHPAPLEPSSRQAPCARSRAPPGTAPLLAVATAPSGPSPPALAREEGAATLPPQLTRGTAGTEELAEGFREVD